jgi:hypothetical protein
MTRPTKERMTKLRESCCSEPCPACEEKVDLLAEIDALEAENLAFTKNYQGLHHDFAVMCGHYNDCMKERDALREKLSVAEGALEFYADEDNYDNKEYRNSIGRVMEYKPILDDGFDTAKQALAKIRGEK